VTGVNSGRRTESTAHAMVQCQPSSKPISVRWACLPSAKSARGNTPAPRPVPEVWPRGSEIAGRFNLRCRLVV